MPLTPSGGAVFVSAGTDPEDTILGAFKLFDPNGTGFVNKEE